MKHSTSLLVAGILACTTLSANTPLLVNTDFASYDKWIAGSNIFAGGNWVAFVGDAYTPADRVKPSGNGFIFTSWDDGVSDRIETYFFQEFFAGPPTSPWPTIFATGDTIVFKGRASATVSDTDVIARAFIKVLGYSSGLAYQTKTAYSAFQPLTSTLTDFEISVVYPDLAVDDSLQVLQIGFELTNSFGNGVMDSGSIYFENIEGYILGTGPTTWAGYDINPDGIVDTGDWMGFLYVLNAPYVYSYDLQNWIYLPEEMVTESGSWAYTLK